MVTRELGFSFLLLLKSMFFLSHYTTSLYLTVSSGAVCEENIKVKLSSGMAQIWREKRDGARETTKYKEKH